MEIESRLIDESAGQTTNISSRGLLFTRAQPAAIDSILELKLKVPNMDLLDVRGKTVRCHPSPDGTYHVAVKFIDLTEADEELLTRVLQQLVPGRSAPG